MLNREKALFLNNVLIMSLDWVESWATIAETGFNLGCRSCGRPAYQHLNLDTQCNYYPNEFVFEAKLRDTYYTLDHELILKALRMIDEMDSDSLNLNTAFHWRIRRAYWSCDSNMLDHEIASTILRIGMFGRDIALQNF